jgi:hypothetical protein
MQRILAVTDVSGQRIGLIFKGQAVLFFLDCLTLKDGTDKCPETSVTNYRSTLRNVPKQRKYLCGKETFKSRQAFLGIPFCTFSCYETNSFCIASYRKWSTGNVITKVEVS